MIIMSRRSNMVKPFSRGRDHSDVSFGGNKPLAQYRTAIYERRQITNKNGSCSFLKSTTSLPFLAGFFRDLGADLHARSEKSLSHSTECLTGGHQDRAPCADQLELHAGLGLSLAIFQRQNRREPKT